MHLERPVNNVAAQLKTFDLSDDLAFRIEPQISQPLMNKPAPGIRLCLVLNDFKWKS